MRKLSLALLASGTLLSTGLLTSAQAAFITGIMQVGNGSNIVEITTNSPLTGTIGFVPGLWCCQPRMGPLATSCHLRAWR
jgi:hypothetical protein